MLTIEKTTATPAPALSVTAPQQPKLLDRMRAAIRIRHYSLATERTYVGWVKRFIYFHQKRHPAEMGAPEVESFLSALATELDVSASTQNQAMHAILFLYRDVLGVTLPWLDGITRAKVSKRLPVVLTVAEVQGLLRRVQGTNGLIIKLLYGTGMRIKECLRLRIKDVDFTRG
ncbi:MAG: phage integrase N-terminal SAM-like domain-containing protein, partial [Betaproteobacteria bacterium]|nr:phage integrase N-terminal SAM-like domain-containing protein [Betaproteobacteria bacterium]